MRSASFLVFVGLWGCAPPEQRIGLDGAHDNLHRYPGRMDGFVEQIRRASDERAVYRVRETSLALDRVDLDGLSVLVIAGAREPVSVAEAHAVQAWVRDGGALWLMVDHPPLVAPSVRVAEAFGIALVAGEVARRSREWVLFDRDAGTLADHPVTEGIETLRFRRGTAFRLADDADALAVLADEVFVDGPEGPVWGLATIAALEVGEGRVLVTAETSMATCYRAGERWIGHCADGRGQGRRLVRNGVAWLAGG